jgi:hypothetical protein
MGLKSHNPEPAGLGSGARRAGSNHGIAPRASLSCAQCTGATVLFACPISSFRKIFNHDCIAIEGDFKNWPACQHYSRSGSRADDFIAPLILSLRTPLTARSRASLPGLAPFMHIFRPILGRLGLTWCRSTPEKAYGILLIGWIRARLMTRQSGRGELRL